MKAVINFWVKNHTVFLGSNDWLPAYLTGCPDTNRGIDLKKETGSVKGISKLNCSSHGKNSAAACRRWQPGGR
jgi:hypothetical protein